MFRLWAKEFKDNRMLRDTVIEVDNDDTRTHKIFHAIDEVCHEFDLSNPIWLDSKQLTTTTPHRFLCGDGLPW